MTTQPRTPRKARSTARSPLLQAVHETAADLDRHGFIDKRPSGPSLKLLHLLDRKGLEAVL